MNPMLATAVGALPIGEGWAYEFKWDGVRVLLDVDERGVHLQSRAGNEVTAGYPEVLAQAADVGDVLLDGEIVAFVDGRPSFEQLQSRMHLRGKADVARAAAQTPVTFMAFDVLRRFGLDLTSRAYSDRRATLERFAAEHAGWTLSPSFDDGPATEEVARGHGLEGVVAKRLSSTYQPGRRTDDWRKLRFVRAGDFVVIGWEAAPAHPATLSSLVLAMIDDSISDSGLRYAGRVGSGLSGRTAAKLKSMLTERTDSPVQAVPPPMASGRRLQWVEPVVVVEIEFLAWTSDGRLRHPVFRGIRTDKQADEAVGEGPRRADDGR